jgi:hypothetical protein
MQGGLKFNPTALGPSLLCILAIVFLSAIVTNATDKRAGTVTIRVSNIEIRIKLYVIVLIYYLIFFSLYNKVFLLYSTNRL